MLDGPFSYERQPGGFCVAHDASGRWVGTFATEDAARLVCGYLTAEWHRTRVREAEAADEPLFANELGENGGA